MTAVEPSVPTGNTFDKYGSSNPVVRRLMAGFEHTLDELFSAAAPASVLDVGCGEGVLTEQWARRLDRDRAIDATAPRVMGVDLADPKLEAEWVTRAHPNLAFAAMRVEELEFADGEFELVAATEVLEHVEDPRAALREMARVAERWLLVSVPHEPLWRALNMARGAYVRDFGNTPGHLNHWSRRSFVSLLSGYGEVTETRSPFPWTMLLVRVAR